MMIRIRVIQLLCTYAAFAMPNDVSSTETNQIENCLQSIATASNRPNRETLSKWFELDDNLWRDISNSQLLPPEIASTTKLDDLVEGRCKVYRNDVRFNVGVVNVIVARMRQEKTGFYCDKIVVIDFPRKSVSMSFDFSASE